MKFTKFLLIASLLTSLCGCSEEQPNEPKKQSVSLWPEGRSHVNIEADLAHSNYTLISDHKEIATATLDDDKTGISIIAHKSGTTMIRLVDTDNDKTICEIYVYVKYFSSPEIIDWGFSLESYSGIIVKATDIEIQKKIENELREESRLLIAAIYAFDKDTRKFTMKTNSGILHEGSYEWNITSLTLIYDDKVEKYGFKFAVGMKDGYIIQADKTEKYQQQYPEASVTEVKVNRVWKDNGIIRVGGLTF